MVWMLTLLARLELGVFLFCDRKRAEAEAAGNTDLTEALRLHAAQELGHHGQLRRLLNAEYTQLSWARQYALAVREKTLKDKKYSEGARVWGAEGISQRYLSTRVWFSGQRAVI